MNGEDKKHVSEASCSMDDRCCRHHRDELLDNWALGKFGSLGNSREKRRGLMSLTLNPPSPEW